MPGSPLFLTRNEQVSGSSPLVGSPIFFGFAGQSWQTRIPDNSAETLVHQPVHQRGRAVNPATETCPSFWTGKACARLILKGREVESELGAGDGDSLCNRRKGRARRGYSGRARVRASHGGPGRPCRPASRG